MGDKEFAYVADAFESNWIAPVGPHVDLFEKEFCESTGARYAAAVSSGSAALHLALLLLGVQSDDEVICSALTFAATANPIIYQNAIPVFIDSEPYSWNMKERIKKGAYYKGRHTGTFGTFGVFSFNGNKIITCSSGGMLVSEDERLIQKAKFLSTQARDPAPHYQHSHIGYNYRLSNILAGIDRGQLHVLEERVQVRRANFDFYKKEMGNLPGIQFMPEAAFGRSNRWLTCLTIDPLKSGFIA